MICGTGIGMAIAANKVQGIRAAVCHDMYSAERARKSNNAQIMAMEALAVGEALVRGLVETWQKSEFAGGASEEKVEEISQIEMRNLKRGQGILTPAICCDSFKETAARGDGFGKGKDISRGKASGDFKDPGKGQRGGCGQAG